MTPHLKKSLAAAGLALGLWLVPLAGNAPAGSLDALDAAFNAAAAGGPAAATSVELRKDRRALRDDDRPLRRHRALRDDDRRLWRRAHWRPPGWWGRERRWVRRCWRRAARRCEARAFRRDLGWRFVRNCTRRHARRLCW